MLGQRKISGPKKVFRQKKRKKIKWGGHKEVKLVHTEVVDMRVDRQVGICLLSS